ncbi:MAG: hypothetical protein ACLFM9_01485 [Candidatus Aenigmatarchaeota archaeon]
MKEKLKKSFKKVSKQIKKIVPMLAAVLLLLGLFKTYITEELIKKVFVGNIYTDPLLGGVLGSISAGNPIESYVIGGELLNHGVSLFAVTAFIITWVTVGSVQFPMESETLGRKFAIKRNVSSFLLALLVSADTVITVNFLGVAP